MAVILTGSLSALSSSSVRPTRSLRRELPPRSAANTAAASVEEDEDERQRPDLKRGLRTRNGHHVPRQRAGHDAEQEEEQETGDTHAAEQPRRKRRQKQQDGEEDEQGGEVAEFHDPLTWERTPPAATER
jgi:hypothetical protein